MNYNLLNEMISYIEDNLTENISYEKLSKIVGVSEYSLQRIFTFLTGISISEYIRKRRLSKAYEELKTTNIKIIDLAVKYNYDSAISFSRAFKKQFNITPSECRKITKKYKVFPVIEFKDDNIYKEFNYEIKEINKKTIYCFKVEAKQHDDLLYKIRQLYKDIRSNGIRDIFDKNGMYGISIYLGDKYEYYVGSEVNLSNTKKVIIEKGKYAVFEVGKIDQQEINKVYDYIYKTWLKSTKYEPLEKPEIEVYENNNCFIYIPIKDKQK